MQRKEPTETLHQIIVEENESSLNFSEIQEKYTHLFVKLFSCTNLMNELDEIYCESYILKVIEITDRATSTTTQSDCIYTYTSLGLQLDFYLNVLKLGLQESCNNTKKLDEYINKYRKKVIKQLWIFLREEKKKAIQFNLTSDEYKKIIYKSYFSTIEGLNYTSNDKFKNLPLYIRYKSDDPIFSALTEYISYYVQSNQNDDNENSEVLKQKGKNKKMVAEGEEDEEDSKNPIDEKILFPNQQKNNKEITDIQLILLNFCTLTLNNPKFIYSNFGIYVLKNFFDSENKEIVEILRKNIAASRIRGDRKSGYPPFWKCFDIILNQLLDEGRDHSHIRKFVAFINQAYFKEAIIDHMGVTRKPNDQIRDLCEREIYYLTAATGKLLDNPNKLSTLDFLGYMISFKINFPKKLDPQEVINIQTLQKKYHTFFLKKVQDHVKEFKENNQHLPSFDNTILSDTSKQIIYRFVKHLELWSGVKFNVDPYGEGEENLNEQRKHAEASIKKEQKNTEEEQEDENERSNQNESGSESESEDEEEEQKTNKKQKQSKAVQQKSTRNVRSARNNSKDNKENENPQNNKMEAENEKVIKSNGTKKTKKQDRKQSGSREKEQKEEKKQVVETSKKNFRRQHNVKS